MIYILQVRVLLRTYFIFKEYYLQEKLMLNNKSSLYKGNCIKFFKLKHTGSIPVDDL